MRVGGGKEVFLDQRGFGARLVQHVDRVWGCLTALAPRAWPPLYLPGIGTGWVGAGLQLANYGALGETESWELAGCRSCRAK